MRALRLLIALGAIGICGSVTARADLIFDGTVFYTNFTSGQNVNKVAFSYNQTTQSLTLGASQNIATTPGADGIIFNPAGNLLVGGQGTGQVYEVNPTNGTFTGVAPGTTGQNQSSYHLTLDPSGTKFYTSDFGGPLDTLPLPFGTQGSTTAISGDETGLTQIAFAPNGNVFYVQGNPNGFGNLGLIDLATGVTSRIHASVQPAHGLLFDPFTGLMTMFGAGETGTMDQNGANLKTGGPFTCDFDQGAVDGFGHALVAGCSSLTFIDYSSSGDITNPDKVIVTSGFNGIDDVAPLVGPGSNPNPNPVPEPSSIVLLGGALLGLGACARRRFSHSA